MSIFTVVITDSHKLAGISSARIAYNTANATVAGFISLLADSDYVQFVMDYAALSYAAQYKV